MLSVRSLLPSRTWTHSAREAPVLTRRAAPAPVSALLPYVYMLIAVMCLLMGSMSIVVCAVCLKTFLSFRNENEYLNAFIQRHLSNVLFLNKYLFVRDAETRTMTSLLAPLFAHASAVVGNENAIATTWRALARGGRAIKGHVQEYGPALAMALLTTHILTSDG